MDPDDAKVLVRRLYWAVEAGDAAALGELLAADYRLRVDDLLDLGRDGAIRFFVGLRGVLPDIRHDVEDQIAEGDRVATRLTVRGTHRGELPEAPPTGAAVAVASIHVHRIAGGRVAEQWIAGDALGVLQRLGLLPTPAVPADPAARLGA